MFIFIFIKANLRPKNFCLGLVRPKVSFDGCLGYFLKEDFQNLEFRTTYTGPATIYTRPGTRDNLPATRDTRQLDSNSAIQPSNNYATGRRFNPLTPGGSPLTSKIVWR